MFWWPHSQVNLVQILLLCDSLALGPGTSGSSSLDLSLLICADTVLAGWSKGNVR